MSKFCHNCGTKLPDDAIFCSGCGTRVKMAETPKPEPVQPEIETPKPEPVQPVVEAPEPEPVHTEIKAEHPEPVQPAVEAPKPESVQPVVEAPKPESVQPEFSNSYIGGNGNPMPPTQPIPGFGAPGGKPEKKKKAKKKKTGLLVFFILVVLLAAGAATVWFLDREGIIELFPKEEDSTTYKEAIDLYVKGIEEQDIDTFLDAYGSFLADEFTDGAGTYFLEETYGDYEEEAGADFKIEYEVTKEKEYTESKLQDLQQDLQEDYDVKDTIEKAYDITTEFTIKGEDGTTDDRVKFLVVKIKGHWYLAEFDD